MHIRYTLSAHSPLSCCTECFDHIVIITLLLSLLSLSLFCTYYFGLFFFSTRRAPDRTARWNRNGKRRARFVIIERKVRKKRVFIFFFFYIGSTRSSPIIITYSPTYTRITIRVILLYRANFACAIDENNVITAAAVTKRLSSGLKPSIFFPRKFLRFSSNPLPNRQTHAL